MDRHPLARKVDDLLEYGWSGMLPVSVDALCRALNVHVAEHDYPGDALVRLVVEGELALILVPEALPLVQRRLYVTFLLALYLSGVTRYDLRPESLGGEQLQGDPTSSLGFCAAAHMLIPRIALEHLLRESRHSLTSLAALLQVGVPVLYHRLVETGLAGRLEPVVCLVSRRPLLLCASGVKRP